ncbi:polysaccharide pyruvyl transferase family protein [Pseudocolwellia agarivorans]|uniref:polysaccharide pyruvyl transferase family protein n=1 Tax=Pseudocolwellia agarivorans TaxID=1911682 RepID=UPI003F880EA8
MKVGIVTFHEANNYGAVLQCHALAEILKKLNHNVELIDLPLHDKIKGLKAQLRDKFISRAFTHFKLNFLPNISVNNDQNEVCVFGSDQVWNPQITKNHHLLYFGSWVKPEVSKIAYAASFGLSTWDFPEYNEGVKAQLESFKALGVREVSGVEICKGTFDVESQQVVDPTLLLTDYSHLFTKRKKTNSLVCYIFGKEEDKMDNIRKIGNKRNLQPVLLNDMRLRKGIKSVPFPTVAKWLSYIEASEFVITDSFHCMVFSILFKKNFIAIPAIPARAGRMKSLLNDLGLESRFFNSINDVPSSDVILENIDYQEVNEKIKTLRENSLLFLKKALEV